MFFTPLTAFGCTWKGEVLNKKTKETKSYVIDGTSPTKITLKENGVDVSCFFTLATEQLSREGINMQLETVSIGCSPSDSKQYIGTSSGRVTAVLATNDAHSQYSPLFLYDVNLQQAFRLTVECN